MEHLSCKVVGWDDVTPVLVDIGVKWPLRGYGRLGRWHTCPGRNWCKVVI